jgi:uncharacterized protein (DUF58 family)
VNLRPSVRAAFPPVWLSPRGIWLVFACGLVYALASVIPILFGAALVCSAIVVALIVADATIGPSRRGFSIVRAPVERASLRRPFDLTYRVENRCATPLRLGILETPAPSLQFDRDTVRATVPARSVAGVRQPVLAIERGLTALGTIYLWAENGVGVLRRRFAIEAPDEVRVYPDMSGVTEYGTLARRSTLVDAGLRRMRLRGVGTDFESVRDYGSGDEFRRIDWKATARRGRLMVAQYETERSQNVILALDCGRLMTPRIGLQRKFDYALTAALSGARIAEAADDNVGLIAFGARPLLNIRPRRGKAHVAAVTAAAYGLQPRLEEPDYERTFAELKSAYSKRSLIVLFTDMFDPAASEAVLSALRVLVPRHVVMVVLMNDEAIANALAAQPVTAREAYRAGVAMRLADERTAAITHLRSRGIIVVDAPAAKLTISLLDAYLDVKARGLI